MKRGPAPGARHDATEHVDRSRQVAMPSELGERREMVPSVAIVPRFPGGDRLGRRRRRRLNLGSFRSRLLRRTFQAREQTSGLSWAAVAIGAP
jgi:hypothetical protein